MTNSNNSTDGYIDIDIQKHFFPDWVDIVQVFLERIRNYIKPLCVYNKELDWFLHNRNSNRLMG